MGSEVVYWIIGSADQLHVHTLHQCLCPELRRLQQEVSLLVDLCCRLRIEHLVDAEDAAQL